MKRRTYFLDLVTQTWRHRVAGIGRDITYSPDSAKLILEVGMQDQIWDLRSDPPTSQVLSGTRQVQFIPTFSPDSQTAVTTGGDGTVRLWNAETGQEMFSELEPGRTFCLPVFSANGTTLAVGPWRPDGHSILFLDAPTLAEIDARIREGRQNQ